MVTNKKRYFLLALMLAGTTAAIAQSKIKDNSISGTPLYPMDGALLELESNNKGLLVPRIALAATTTWGLSGTDTAGMLVYNNNPALSGTVAAPALSGGIGFYYWDGARWVGMSAGSGTGDFWRLNGNTGTTPPATVGTAAGSAHYWGTNDTSNLAVGTNGIIRAVFDRSGNLYGGSNTKVYDAISGSLAWGSNHTDSAANSLVAGNYNTLNPSAFNTVVAGDSNIVAGSHAAVFGQLHNNAATYSLVAGASNKLSAGADNSTVTGFKNYLSGPNAAVFGQNNADSAGSTLVAGYSNEVRSSAVGSIISGGGNTVSGNLSAVFGQGHSGSANYTLIAGQNNITSAGMHHGMVVGAYNMPLDGALLTIGNGSSASRSNAFTITDNQTTGATGAGQANGMIIISAALPRYSSTANANADASLPSGAFYKISGAVYQKD